MIRVLLSVLLILFMSFPTSAANRKSTKGTYFDAGNIKYIVKWRTSEKDVLRLFGEPVKKEVKSRYDQVWTYIYYETEHIPVKSSNTEREYTRPGEARSLEITLRKGIVADFSIVEFNTPISDFNEPIEFSGFSIRPPQGPKWKILMRSKKEITFVRKTDVKRTSIIAFVSMTTGEGDETNAPDEMERIARKKLEKMVKNPGLKELKLKRSAVQIDNHDGIELRGIMMSSDGKSLGNDQTFTSVYHVCFPYKNNEEKGIVHMGYIQRVRKGGEPLDIEKEIAPFIKSFRYKGTKK